MHGKERIIERDHGALYYEKLIEYKLILKIPDNRLFYVKSEK